MIRATWLTVLLILLLPSVLFAQGRELVGQVLQVGPQGEATPAEGIEITLTERGDTVRTRAQGLFRLFVPEIFEVGEKITLTVTQPGWVIQYPLDGEIRLPAEPEKDVIQIRLLPKGSKKLWTDERIEKFIVDTAEKAKQQVTPEGLPEDIDFGRYIKEWSTQYGFSAAEAQAEIDQWVAEVQRKQDDFYQLGLAAFAEKNFGKANELFTTAAETKAKQLEATRQKEETLTEETVRDFRLAGDAAYSNYAFEKALVPLRRNSYTLQTVK